MWIKAQNGRLVNINNSTSIGIFKNEIRSYCGYDSLEHDYLWDVLGTYKNSNSLYNVRDAIYRALGSGVPIYTMPKDGD